MKVSKFLEVINKAYESQNIYMLGTFGQLITENLIKSKEKQLPYFYTSSRVATCRAKNFPNDYFWSGIFK